MASVRAQVYFVLMTPWCFSFYFLRCLGFRPCCSPGRPGGKDIQIIQHTLCKMPRLASKFQSKEGFEAQFSALTFLVTIMT